MNVSEMHQADKGGDLPPCMYACTYGYCLAIRPILDESALGDGNNRTVHGIRNIDCAHGHGQHPGHNATLLFPAHWQSTCFTFWLHKTLACVSYLFKARYALESVLPSPPSPLSQNCLYFLTPLFFCFFQKRVKKMPSKRKETERYGRAGDAALQHVRGMWGCRKIVPSPAEAIDKEVGYSGYLVLIIFPSSSFWGVNAIGY